jgi:hypothetical protein
LSDLAQLRTLLDQLPQTAEYGTARQIGDVLVKVIEDADRVSSAKRRSRPVDRRPDPGSEDDVDCWQPIGVVARRIVSRIRVKAAPDA